MINLSTATVVTSDIANDLLKSFKVGEDAYRDFKTKHLETSPPTAQFHDKMTKINLKTFSQSQLFKGRLKEG